MSQRNPQTPADLNDRERKFIHAHLKGLVGLAATADAGFSYKTQESATAAMRRILSYPGAQTMVAEVKAKVEAEDEEKSMLSIKEKRQFLARIVRCRISKEDDNSDLWQEIRESGSGENETVHRKLMAKEKAIQLDNELAGHKAPEKVEHSADDELAEVLRDIAKGGDRKGAM